MSTSLVRTVSTVVFGSAVAGFGFGMGRDAYRKFKRNWQLVLIIAAVLGAAYLSFMSSSKTYRWYPLSSIKWFFTIFLPWHMLSALGLLLTFMCIPSAQVGQFSLIA